MGDTIVDLGMLTCCGCGDWLWGVLYGFSGGMADCTGVRE